MKLKSYIAALHAALLCILLAASPAGSGSMTLLGVGKAAGGGGSFSLTFSSSNTSSDFTHTTVDYGVMSYASGATRIIVANLWFPGGTISGITIGGVALAQVSGAFVTVSSSFSADVWESTAPLSGSSGDVQVTYTSTLGFVSSVALYSLVTTTPTRSDVQVTSTPSATSLSVNSTITAGGAALVAVGTANGRVITPTNYTIDATMNLGGNNAYYGHTTSTGSVSVSGAWTPADPAILSVVAWAP